MGIRGKSLLQLMLPAINTTCSCNARRAERAASATWSKLSDYPTTAGRPNRGRSMTNCTQRPGSSNRLEKS